MFVSDNCDMFLKFILSLLVLCYWLFEYFLLVACYWLFVHFQSAFCFNTNKQISFDRVGNI